MRDIADYKRNMQRNENQSNRGKTNIERESMHDNITQNIMLLHNRIE